MYRPELHSALAQTKICRCWGQLQWIRTSGTSESMSGGRLSDSNLSCTHTSSTGLQSCFSFFVGRLWNVSTKSADQHGKCTAFDLSNDPPSVLINCIVVVGELSATPFSTKHGLMAPTQQKFACS